MERTRIVNRKTSHEVFYYVSSLAPDPKLIARHIRGHWSVENQLHHCLDVAFREDARGAFTTPMVPQNFALITRIALLLIKHENSRKLSLAMKRRDAAWNHDYLLRILTAGIFQV